MALRPGRLLLPHRAGAEAQREFEALAANDFEDLPRDGVWITSLMLLASLCGRIGDRRRAELIYRLLGPYPGVLAVGRPLVVVVAPVDLRLGTLASLLERFEEADAHFADALGIAERMRALPWQAEMRYECAVLLGRRAARGDRERAIALLDESAEIARGVGMQLLLGFIERAREQVGRQAVARAVAVGARTARRSEPAGARWCRWSRPAAAPAGAATASARPAERTGTFRRDGGMWTLVFEGRTTHFRHMLGLAHLARLLHEPDREIHVGELVGSASARGREDAAGSAAPPGDAGVLLDARARADYAARLRDARRGAGGGERLNDRGQTSGSARRSSCSRPSCRAASASAGARGAPDRRASGRASRSPARSSTPSTRSRSTTPRWPSTSGSASAPGPSASTRPRAAIASPGPR